MRCPYCTALESRVVDSRLAADGTVTWRRRECDACKKRFTTYERVEHALPLVSKRDGKREPFDRQKLLGSLRIACSKRPVSVDTLEAEAEGLERELATMGEREVASSTIGERVMDRLRALDEVAYVRFASVYRSFRDVDEFMAEIAKMVRPQSQDIGGQGGQR
ncbi:transcriptional regulator NrdR [Myxococcota bacterium]